MPAIGVSVRHLPQTLVRDLRARGHRISICTITMVELAAKGAKLVRDGKLKEDRVLEGLQAILSDETVDRINFQQGDVWRRAISARYEIDDFVDCLILSSAAVAADALVSEDETIAKAVSDEMFRMKLQPSNEAFAVYPSRSVP